MFKYFMLTSLFLSFLYGCSSSSPFLADVRNEPVKVVLEDQITKDKISYLGRFLMESKDRNALLARLMKEGQAGCKECLFASGYTLYSTSGTLGGMGLGVGLMAFDLGSDIIDIFVEWGALDRISGFAMPEIFMGQSVQSETQAWQLAVSHTERQLKKAANATGYSVRCIAGCEDGRRIYELKLVNDRDNSRYIFQPGKIALITDYGEMKKIERPHVLDTASLDFVPAYQTIAGNQWVFRMFGEPNLDDNGDIIVESGKYGIFFRAKQGMEGTEVQRDIMRFMTDDGGYMYFGTDKAYPNYIAYRGNLYSYSIKMESKFINSTLIER